MYVTQEKDADLCMGIADLSYGEFPRNILQQIDNVSVFPYYTKHRKILQ